MIQYNPSPSRASQTYCSGPSTRAGGFGSGKTLSICSRSLRASAAAVAACFWALYAHRSTNTATTNPIVDIDLPSSAVQSAKHSRHPQPVTDELLAEALRTGADLRTRDGHRARLTESGPADPDDPHTLQGEIFFNEPMGADHYVCGWYPCSWFSNGRHAPFAHPWDLVSVETDGGAA